MTIVLENFNIFNIVVYDNLTCSFLNTHFYIHTLTEIIKDYKIC